MTIRAYVVDDEPLAVERLVRLLEATGRVTVVRTAGDPHVARAFLQSQAVDVLFLDIRMPGLDGFQLLASLDAPPWVVFTTAFDEFAVKAFDTHAIAYLLKPIAPAALERALDKLEAVRAQGLRAADVHDAIESAVRRLRTRPSYPERLASRLGDRVSFIDVASITHVRAEDKLTWAFADGRSYALDAPLTDLESRLDPRRFVRVHRATVVNLRWVAEARADGAGGLVLVLSDRGSTRVDVARARVAEVRARLGM